MNETGTAVKARVHALRLRTLTLTLIIVITLGFYLCVDAILKESINFIDFAILAFVQITTHCLYFPDGEIFGGTNVILVNNRQNYNDKATLVNSKMQFSELKEYTRYDFEQRQLNYIETECGYIGITYDDYLELKHTISYNDLKAPQIELNGKVIFLSKAKRKALKRILFSSIPIGYNKPETIMSALENDKSYKITDKSRSYKIQAYIRKVFMAVIVGGVLAYIGYTAKDGFGLNDVVRMLMYLSSILTTAIMSYSSGEVCQRVYKNEFYIELGLFLDNFFEWLLIEKGININTITPEEIRKIKNEKKILKISENSTEGKTS